MRRLKLLLPLVSASAFSFGAGLKLVYYVFALPDIVPLVNIVDAFAIMAVSLFVLLYFINKWWKSYEA